MFCKLNVHFAVFVTYVMKNGNNGDLFKILFLAQLLAVILLNAENK